LAQAHGCRPCRCGRPCRGPLGRATPRGVRGCAPRKARPGFPRRGPRVRGRRPARPSAPPGGQRRRRTTGPPGGAVGGRWRPTSAGCAAGGLRARVGRGAAGGPPLASPPPAPPRWLCAVTAGGSPRSRASAGERAPRCGVWGASSPGRPRPRPRGWDPGRAGRVRGAPAAQVGTGARPADDPLSLVHPSAM